MSFNLQKTKKKENLVMLLLNRKKKIMLKENGKKKCMNCINIFCFLVSLKTIMFQKNISKNILNMVKKSNFVKENKTVVRSSHLPLGMFIINCKRTEIKASPFKIVEIIDVNTSISTKTKKIIEQNNFVTAHADNFIDLWWVLMFT